MKKLIKNIFSFAIITVLFVGCDDRLEIEPEDALSNLITFNDFGLIEGSVLSMYNVSQSGNINGIPQIISDFMSDNANFVGSFTTLQDIRDFRAQPDNNSATPVWTVSYALIRTANNIIVNLEPVNPDDVTGLTAENKAQFIAEARFVRALAHFDLVDIYAQPFQVNGGSNLGVPIIQEFFAGDSSPFLNERNTVNEVHEFIRTELIAALPNLPASATDRATQSAAEAILARLHLYRGEWAEAAQRANNALNGPGVGLAPDYSWIENNSSEHIYRIINLSDDGSGGGYDTFYNPASNNGRGDLPFTQDLIDSFNEEPGDLRSTFVVSATDAGANPGALFTTKYPSGTNTSESDAYVIRAAEMVLTRAEANLMNGSAIGATPLEDLNAIRVRAQLGAVSTVTLPSILNERRKELCFEGHRRMDLLRNGLNLRPSGDPVSSAGGNFTVLPIPQSEINRNPNITQNPGYGN